jgi:hypothetical protein
MSIGLLTGTETSGDSTNVITLSALGETGRSATVCGPFRTRSRRITEPGNGRVTPIVSANRTANVLTRASAVTPEIPGFVSRR